MQRPPEPSRKLNAGAAKVAAGGAKVQNMRKFWSAIALPLIAMVASIAVACGGGDSTPTPTGAPLSTATPPTEPGTTVPSSTPAAATPTSSEPAATATPSATSGPPVPEELTLEAFPVPAGSAPHEVARAPDGRIWYTAQGAGALGWLDPETGETRHIALGAGSRPHGVIVGPERAAWVTDGGLNAIVRVDPVSEAVTVFPLPGDRPNANLNTATFDLEGRLWFTGQNGVIGRLDAATGDLDAPRGTGPYGITTTPAGDVYFASLAGSYIGRIDLESGAVEVIEPPTAGQGARRVWSDSEGRIWVSEWNAGQLARYDPEASSWQEWPLPGSDSRAYAVYVDGEDVVWVRDFGGNALWRFDPVGEVFFEFPPPSSPSNVRQILGRTGEVWAPESAADQLIVIR